MAPLPYPDPVTLDVHLSLVSLQELNEAAQYLDSIVDLEIVSISGQFIVISMSLRKLARRL